MIVVDVNVIAYLFLEGERTAAARAVWRLDPEWRFPPLWRSEYLNVLATWARSGAAGEDDALSLGREAFSFLAPGEREPEPSSALALAIRHGISAYDAQYLALAESPGLPLLTEDRRLLRTFPETAISMQAFVDAHAE